MLSSQLHYFAMPENNELLQCDWLISDCICVNNHSNIVPNEVATERKSMLYVISAQLWNKIDKYCLRKTWEFFFIFLMGY